MYQQRAYMGSERKSRKAVTFQRTRQTPARHAYRTSAGPAAVLVASLGMLSLFDVLLPATARPVDHPQSQPAQETPYRIKSNVDLVVLQMTVQDREGGFASGLGKDDFQVHEDGAPQAIQSFSHEDVPVTVGLIVDNSGSMQAKRQEVIAAALAFARSSNPRDEMFVVNFNDTVSFGLPRDTPFTDQPDQLQSALSNVATEGQTALYDAIYYGLGHLKNGTRDRKALIVISDGGDNVSRHMLAEIMEMTMHSDAIFYTVGLFDANDPDRKPGVLKQLSKATGGETFLPASIPDLLPACRRIASAIRNQYTLVYESTNKKDDGSYRSIRVTAKAPGRGRLSVRTRTGYYAPSNSQSSRVLEQDNHGTAH